VLAGVRPLIITLQSVQVQRAANNLEDEVDRLTSFLGAGRMVEAARAVIVALESRAAAVDRARTETWLAIGNADRPRSIQQSLEEHRSEALEARNSFARFAGEALRQAVPPSRPVHRFNNELGMRAREAGRTGLGDSSD